MAKRKSKKRSKGYLLPKYQDEGDVKKYATEPIKETSFGDWWEDFEKSKAGKFVDARGLRGDAEYLMGSIGDYFGYENTAEDARRMALDATAIVNPIPDFINAADHAQQGKYSDAGLYAGAAILPGAAAPIVNKVKNQISKIPNPFKFTEESFEKYAREGRHFLDDFSNSRVAPRNPLAKYIDDLRYFPQLQKRKKAINQGLEEIKKAKKEWKDFLAKPENKKNLEKEMKLFTKTNDRRSEVKDLLSNKYGRGHSLDDSKTSMGTQFAGWLDSQGLLTKEVMQNPSLVINDEKLVNAFIENYSKAVRGVRVGNVNSINAKGKVVNIPDEITLKKVKDALETTSGRGQHGYGHYQSNSDKIKDQFSVTEFPHEGGFYSDVSLNIPGVSKAKTPKEKIDIIKKTVTDFSDPAASRNIGQRTYDNQIVVNPYGGDSRERFIPNEMFQSNFPANTVKISGPIQKGRNIADPLINQKKGAIGLADATANSKYFTQISREKIAELKEYDPDIRSAINKFKDSKYSKELESLKNMLDFRLNKLDYNFPHNKANREAAVNISEIKREISLSSVFSEAEKAKIKAMLPKKSHITSLDDELGYGVSDLRRKDLQRKIRDSEDAVLRTIFGTGVVGTAVAGVGIPIAVVDALYTSPFEKMIEETNLTEEEWDKLSIEEKHELDYQWSIKNKRPQRDGSLMSDEEIKENIYKRKYQNGGPIPKYQDGNEVFQIPEDLMQQHKNELKLVESADGVLMKNPESTATGFYGQLFSEIKNLPEMKGITRDKFAKDTALQNQIYDIRFQEGIPDANNVKNSTVKNLNDLYVNYAPQIKEKGYSPMDLAGIVNLLGRQGTREFFGDHVRDKKSLSKVFPTKYGKSKKQANHTPDEYVEKMRSIRPDNLKNYNYDTQTYTNNTSSSKGVFAPDYMPDYKPFPLQVPYDYMNPDTLSKEGIMDLQSELLKDEYFLGTSGKNKDGVDGEMGLRTRNAYEDMLSQKHGIEIGEDGEVGFFESAMDQLSNWFSSDNEIEPENLPSIITNKGDTLRGEEFDNYIGKPGAYERALKKATKKEDGAEVDSVISMLENMHGKHDNIPVTSEGFHKVKGDRVILPGKGEEISVTTEQMTEPIKVTGSDGRSKVMFPGENKQFRTPVYEEKFL